MTNYYHNETIYCSQCNKLRYMGYTDKPDSELCTCADQDNIPTIIKYKSFKMMTQEQDGAKSLAQLHAEQNAKIQNETWIRSEKARCRERALSLAAGYKCPDADQTIKQADILYEWLIKDLEQNEPE